jgi:hypothetical protein
VSGVSLTAGRNTVLQIVPAVAATPNSNRIELEDVRRSAHVSSGVKAQLRLILQSEWFAQSERMRRFLEFVTEETLAGRADQLCEYAIGVAVFDQHHSFEPALNPIVRNDARRLRHKLHEYYRHTRAEADRVLIDIPKGAYIPVFRPLHLENIDAGQELPQVKLRVAVFRNGLQVCGFECQSAASERFDVEVSVVPATGCITSSD